MSNLKHLSLEQLQAERTATLKRIEDLRLKNEISNSPQASRRRSSTISGQRERIKWIDTYIARKEQP